MSKPRYSTLVRALKFLQIEADFSLNGCSQKEIRDSYSGLHKAARGAESLVARAVGEKPPRTKKGKTPNAEVSDDGPATGVVSTKTVNRPVAAPPPEPSTPAPYPGPWRLDPSRRTALDRPELASQTMPARTTR